MEESENTIKLYYNTEVEKLQMPEYGRNVLQMVEQLKTIPDRAKRTEQAHSFLLCLEYFPGDGNTLRRKSLLRRVSWCQIHK